MVRIASYHRSQDDANPPRQGANLAQSDDLEPLIETYAKSFTANESQLYFSLIRPSLNPSFVKTTKLRTHSSL